MTPLEPYPSEADPIRVVLADDSAVIRGLLTRILEEDPTIKVVASGSNGEHAIALTTKFAPDIVILDIEMPVMDGITALPQVIKACPGVKVLICSTLSLKNADITLKALSLGAADAIAKPGTTGQIIATENDFKANLINMVKQIAKGSNRPTKRPELDSSREVALGRQALSTAPKGRATFTLRDPKTAYAGKPAILAIGSSTGGPPALFKVLKFCKGIDIPILITQHMPPTFTSMLAQHIEQNTGIKTVEAKDGDVIKPGQAYVAPGGFHMVVKVDNNIPTLHLNTEPPENFCRPAVDPMLRSVVAHYGAKTLAVILTGMGADGLAGAKPLIDAGGRLFAQDEATSVVWGMPGAVAVAGLCHAVVPLDDMGPLIFRTIMGSKAGS